MVGHNLKFDLSWLLECGFKYEGKIWDTMVAESVLFRGQRKPLSLKECCRAIFLKSQIQKIPPSY